MNRWAVRMMGIVLVVALLLMLWFTKQMFEQMVQQRTQQHVPR